MKKTLLLIFISFLCIIPIMAQKPQVAIFVYANNDTPTNALRSQLTTSFIEGGNSSFDVVDRSDEILRLLQQEYHYQGSGMVSDNQLISVGGHIGASYICAVAITYYPQYSQYFFEGKIIDVQTRQVKKNSLYPKDDKSVINSMDPITQIKVGRELAEQLNLYSYAQLKEKRGLNVGDIYEGYRYSFPKLRIGYLDATGKHGIAYYVEDRSHGPSFSGSDLKSPTCAQLKLLYDNRNILGLYGEYWSCELAKKHKNGWGDWSEDWYYTIDFSNGSKQKRRCGSNDTEYENIMIYEF